MDADFWLIQRIKKGDDAAIEEFVRKYYPKILHYCFLRIDDYGHAEELTQETFLRFFQSFKQYRHVGKAANYLYVIAGNLCKDYYKKRREVSHETLPESLIEKSVELELQLDIAKALARLPDELKEVAVLFFFQELSQREIAKLLEIKLSLVKYRVSRAKKLLAEYLGEEGER